MPTVAQNIAKIKSERTYRLSEALSRAETFLRDTATTNDFFNGYSLSEAIKVRLDEIGRLKADATTNVQSSGLQLPTKHAELDQLEEMVHSTIAESRSVNSSPKVASMLETIDENSGLVISDAS